MIKTEIGLTEKQNDFLNVISVRTGKSQSDLIRNAIERLIAEFDRQINQDSVRIIAKIHALRGKYAHVRTDSKAFVLRKQEDLDLEEYSCQK